MNLDLEDLECLILVEKARKSEGREERMKDGRKKEEMDDRQKIEGKEEDRKEETKREQWRIVLN